MKAGPVTKNANVFALVPSVDDLIRTEAGQALLRSAGRQRLTELCRVVIDDLRSDLQGRKRSNDLSKPLLLNEACSLLTNRWAIQKNLQIRRVINATGVIIHTNLGRAPLSQAARNALFDAAGYCNVEYDLNTGQRGQRGARVELMLCELTGAEDALVVNNCAAAAYLVLTAFAAGTEVVISRGELVEIGGEFRVPDVLARSGALLREVGTTNRTKIADYENAINDNTSMILKVHPSNYRIVGFTQSPLLKDLAYLAHRRGILLFEDAGSGAVCDLSSQGLGDEPVIKRSIEAGADIVSFSGDKLLGGPQAGIIVGSRSAVEKLRKDPLYRALRVSKLVYAALEATLDSHLRGEALAEVPVLQMIETQPSEIEERTSEFVHRVKNENLQMQLTKGNSAIGGGSGPTVHPDTTLISVKHVRLSATQVEAILRSGDPPVITRILDDKVLIDLRTVSDAEESELVAALETL